MDLPWPLTEPDEARHAADGEALWNESWYLDFTTADGSLGGYVRTGLYPNLGTAWYWACVVGEGRPLVTVIDHGLRLPPDPSVELRGDGLWADHTVEDPFERFTVGLEAFALRLDDPADAVGDMRGERVPLGFELEWETAGGAYAYPGVSRYEIPCRVHGRIVVDDETIDFEGHGERDHSWGHRDWWSYEWCWTSGRLSDGTAFHSSRPLIEGIRYEPGFVQAPGGKPEPIDGFQPEEDLDAARFPTAARMQLGRLSLAVTPLHFAPVRLDAPDGRVGRLLRALCRFEEAGGASGYGWTEWNQPPA